MKYRKHTKVVLSIFLCLALEGCTAMLPKGDRPEIPVIVSTLSPTSPAKNLGAVTATDGSGCGLLGLLGNRENAIYALKQRAAQAGANYVQILKTKEPYSDGRCKHNAYVIEGNAYKTQLTSSSTTINKTLTDERIRASSNTKSIEGYLFTLTGCTLSNQIVGCDLSVVRKTKDGKVELRTSMTSIFDNIGTQFVSDSISLGKKKSERTINHRLIRGIPLNLRLSFFVSPETSSIALLEIRGWVGGSAINNGLRFRNIALQ